MPFNPDRFLAETEPDTSFNPDKFLEKTKPDPGFLEQAGRATVNALPMLGTVAGGILGTPADAIAGPGGNIAGAGIGGYLGTAAKNAINSYIDPAAAPKTTGAALLDPIAGGAVQALEWATGEATAPYLAAGASKISPAIRDYLLKLAETRMGKALGATKAAFRKEGADSIRETGRYALDNDIAGSLTSAETMADRNAAVGQQAMAGRQKIYDAIDSGTPPPLGQSGTPNPNSSAPLDLGFTPAAPASGGKMSYDGPTSSPYGPDLGFTPAGPANTNASSFLPKPAAGASQYNPLEAAQAIQKKVGSLNPKDPLHAQALDQLNKILDSVRLNGAEDTTMAAGQAKQEQLQGLSNFDATRPNAANQVAQDASGAHREYLNQAAENAAGDIGGQDLKSQMQDANYKYSQGQKAAKLLNNRTASELGNKTFGLTDTILAAGAGNLPGAAAEVGIKKTAEKYGNQNIALGADWLAKVVDKAPQTLGKWAAPLTQAAARGGNSLPATDFILQQTDPEYREHLRSISGQNQDEEGQ